MYVSFKIVKPNELNSKYLLLLLKSDEFKNIINNESYGAVRKQLRFNDLCKIEIPIPSIEEQNKIVEKIEGKLKEIDKYNLIIQNINDELNEIYKDIIY